QLVRRINKALPRERRRRVLAGEDAVDWRTVTPAKYNEYLQHREEHIASVIETEVLAKHRKALMFYGEAHVLRESELAVNIYEAKYPGVTFVVVPYIGASEGERCGLPLSGDFASLEAKMTMWPAPSIVRTKGTALAEFAKATLVLPDPFAQSDVAAMDPVD